MKRLFIALTAVLTAPRIFAGAFVLYDHKPSLTADTAAAQLPEVEIVAQPDSRAISSAIPYHELDSEKIKTAGITDISDALRRLPGINLRDYGGAGGLKTVSVRGLGAAHTGVVYDGVALSDVRSSEIDLSRYSLVNVATLGLSAGDNEDIFIPARNVSSATSIIISSMLPPAQTDRTWRLNAKMKAGSWSLYNPFLKATFSDRSRFSVSALADYTFSKNDYPFTLENGVATARERRSHSKMNALHTEVNAIFTPSSVSSLSAKLYYYDNSRQLPGPVKFYVENTDEHLHDRNFFAQTQWRSRLSSIFSISLTGKFNWAASHYIDISGSYPGGKLDQNYIQREAYLTGSLLATPLPNLALDWSADWFYNNLTSNLPTDRHPYRNSILQSLSAKYTVGNVSAIARLLYSLYIDRRAPLSSSNAETDPAHKTSSRLSPSLALSWQPIRDASFYVRGSYKNIFRIPTFNELYFDNYGSALLRPEKTDQFNIGLTYSFPGSGILSQLSVTADGYLNLVRDKIVAIPYNLFKWTMTNLGKARMMGVDLTLSAEIDLHPLHSLMLEGSYSYLRAQPRTSPDMLDWMKQVAYTPLNSGSASLSWLNPWVSLALHTTGVSARYTTNSNLAGTRLSGYMEAGIAAFHTFQFKNSSLELRADLINMLDKQYVVVARYPMPGRSWTVSANFIF